MATVFEFEGNLVRKVERTVSEIGRVSDLLPTLMTYHPIEFGTLPRDTVYLKSTPQEGTNRVDADIIVLQPPQVRNVLFNESGGGLDTQRSYRLAMPYFGFWFRMQGSPVNVANEPHSMLWTPRSWGIFWTRQPFSGTDMMATNAKMPNSWGDTRVCFGANAISGALTMGAHIDTLINTYWTSVFNTDLDINGPVRGRPRTMLNAWEERTAANSDAWMNFSFWDTSERPLQELIGQVAGYDQFMQPAPDSTEPHVPTPPVQRTWYAINEWVQEELDDGMRDRLMRALQGSYSQPELPDGS